MSIHALEVNFFFQLMEQHHPRGSDDLISICQIDADDFKKKVLMQESGEKMLALLV